MEKNDKKLYFIYYEKLFFKEANSFLEGLEWIFGLYYMLNETYPKSVSLTLEFLQRLCLKIQANEMRGMKKTKSNQSRVFNLINKLPTIN